MDDQLPQLPSDRPENQDTPAEPVTTGITVQDIRQVRDWPTTAGDPDAGSGT